MLVCGIKALGRPAGVAVRLDRLGARRALRERRRGGARASRRGPGTCAPPPRLHPLGRRQHARSRSSTWHRARTPHAPGRTGGPSLVAASPPHVSAPACCITHYAAQPCAPRAHEVKLAACWAPCWDSPDRRCLAQPWSPLRCERGGGDAVWGRALRSTGARACCPSCPRCRWRRAGARAPHEGKPAALSAGARMHSPGTAGLRLPAGLHRLRGGLHWDGDAVHGAAGHPRPRRQHQDTQQDAARGARRGPACRAPVGRPAPGMVPVRQRLVVQLAGVSRIACRSEPLARGCGSRMAASGQQRGTCQSGCAALCPCREARGCASRTDNTQAGPIPLETSPGGRAALPGARCPSAQPAVLRPRLAQQRCRAPAQLMAPGRARRSCVRRCPSSTPRPPAASSTALPGRVPAPPAAPPLRARRRHPSLRLTCARRVCARIKQRSRARWARRMRQPSAGAHAAHGRPAPCVCRMHVPTLAPSRTTPYSTLYHNSGRRCAAAAGHL